MSDQCNCSTPICVLSYRFWRRRLNHSEAHYARSTSRCTRRMKASCYLNVPISTTIHKLWNFTAMVSEIANVAFFGITFNQPEVEKRYGWCFPQKRSILDVDVDIDYGQVLRLYDRWSGHGWANISSTNRFGLWQVGKLFRRHNEEIY